MAGTRVHLVVTGQVQGVAYRAAAVAEARRRALCGWVRNRFDGSVELEAEGPAEDVDAFVAWARRGPPAARVEGVEVTAAAPTGLANGFHVGTTG
jgi:acylphosphatase